MPFAPDSAGAAPGVCPRGDPCAHSQHTGLWGHGHGSPNWDRPVAAQPRGGARPREHSLQTGFMTQGPGSTHSRAGETRTWGPGATRTRARCRNVYVLRCLEVSIAFS